MANFIGLVYATLKNEGIDTKGMSTDEAVAKYNELQKRSGGKGGENEPTPAENRKLGLKTKRANLPYQGKQNALKHIMEDIGVNEEEAKEIYSAFDDYTGNLYEAIRNEKINYDWAKKDRELLENYIEKSPAFDGIIYRGINLNDVDGEKYLNTHKVGDIIDMGGISSWTGDKKRANKFASKKGLNYKIIFESDNKSGVGIQHLSTYDQEDEVMVSSKQKYKIKSIKKQGNYHIVSLEEID